MYNDSMPAADLPTTPNPENKKIKKPKYSFLYSMYGRVIITAILMFLLFCMAALIVISTEKYKRSSQSQPSPSPTSSGETDMSSWQTYTNKEQNYSFSYNEDFGLINEGDGPKSDYFTSRQTIIQYCPKEFAEHPNCAPIFGHIFMVTVFMEGPKEIEDWRKTPLNWVTPKDFDEWIEKSQFSPLVQKACATNDPNTVVEELDFHGRRAVRFKYDINREYCPEEPKWDYSGSYLLIHEKGKVYVVGYNVASTNGGIKALDQILSTFKFLPDASDWETYRNERLGFEIKYPEKIGIKEKGVVELKHSIPHTHPNPCNFSSAILPDLAELVDFSIEIDTSSVNLEKTLVSREPEVYKDYWEDNKLKEEAGFIESVNIHDLKGFKIYQGIEGCGYYNYYFPVNLKTLIIRRHQITELLPVITEYKENLSLPGIIKPEEEEELFNQILSSFKFIE